MLAEQGADVVHVDPPGGPHWNVPADAFLNRSKRRISLDLKDSDDAATAQRISATPMRVGSAARRPGTDAYDVFSEIGSADMIPALERAWALQIADAPPGW